MARLRQKNKIGTSVETFFHQSMKIKIILTPVLKKDGSQVISNAYFLCHKTKMLNKRERHILLS